MAHVHFCFVIFRGAPLLAGALLHFYLQEWDMIFANQAMTVAAIDRLVHHATILEIITESYRKNQSMQKTKQ